ncbi:MAG: hypothetical protein IVW54_16405 [Candidatus Binataceae bacterium]|nr:hypothetical protein [Candidatus Binataceae bacterium]
MATLHKLDPLRVLHERSYKRAAAEFPEFCHEWQHKLQARQQYNLTRIDWRVDHGTENGTYVGYGPISSCVTKMSDGGVSIGKLTYDEYTYMVSGKTVADARHAQPKPVSTVRTLEIFRFDHNRWFE